VLVRSTVLSFSWLTLRKKKESKFYIKIQALPDREHCVLPLDSPVD